MAMKQFVLIVTTQILLSSKVMGTQVQFFGTSNFTDLVHEFIATENCQNLSNEEVNSVKSDTCLIVYKHLNCQSWSSGKILPGNTVWNGVKSFHKCNEKEGGSQLNVDITTYFNPVDPVTIPTVIQQFRDLCTCVNIPRDVEKLEKWSINNHGNKLLAYFQPDCSETQFKPVLIKAGNSIFSLNMHMYERIGDGIKNSYKIQSLGPDPNSIYFKTNCHIPLIVREKLHELEKKLSFHQMFLEGVNQKQSEGYRNEAMLISSLQKKNKEFESKFEELEQKFRESEEERLEWKTKVERMMEINQEESTQISTKFNQSEYTRIKLEQQLASYTAALGLTLHGLEEKLGNFEMKLDRCQRNVEYIIRVTKTPKNFETFATWIREDSSQSN